MICFKVSLLCRAYATANSVCSLGIQGSVVPFAPQRSAWGLQAHQVEKSTST